MQTILVLFGGVSPEHTVSLRSATAVLSHMNPIDRRILPVGITETGQWILFGGTDYTDIQNNDWEQHPDNRRAFLSPETGVGLQAFRADGTLETIPVDVIFPVLHGENGEDGSIQGLFRLSGIPYVGCGVAASAVSMDKSIAKLIAATTGVRQADWDLVYAGYYQDDPQAVCERIQTRFEFPVFIKPCSTGSSVGVSKVKRAIDLPEALEQAFRYDDHVLVEEFIDGIEVETAVLGNRKPIAATPGEIDSGVEFYDYESKYVTATSSYYIPARVPDTTLDRIRHAAIAIYRALGCKGLSRVDFFVTKETGEIVFNEINTLPGFTSISMYPKMFEADGIGFTALLDRLIALALEG